MNQPEIQTLLTEARQKCAAGDFARALELANKAKALDPMDSAPTLMIGQCQRALGNPSEAAKTFEFLIGHFPKAANLYTELGLAKSEAGAKGEGYQCAKKAIELEPNSQFSLEGFGFLALKQKRWPEAIKAFNVLIKMDPDQASYYPQLCEALKATYRFQDAISAFHHFIRLTGRSGENLYQMGMLCFLGNLYEDAVSWFEEASRGDPKNEKPVFYRARCHIQLGDLKTATALARKALLIKPDSVHTLALLHELNSGEITQENIQPLCALLKTGQIKGQVEWGLGHLFLGRVFQENQEYETAFGHFKTANDDLFRAYSNQGVVYDKELTKKQFSETKKLFTRDAMASMSGGGSKSDVPILIVSMPRSGTTLLEQIISMHSKVKGLGEFKAMDQVVYQLNSIINQNRQNPIAEVIKENAANWANIYLQEISLEKGQSRATDKMPVNFLFLGIFQAMFPNARVIHIKRHPLDTCLSLYTNDLRGSYPYTTKFENLGHYFNLHADLMRFWKENLSLKYLELCYAELVDKPEEKAREVMEFCGLDFEDKVLEFHKGKKSAYTISQVQVSEPINKKGVGRWRHYKKHIGPLIEALDEDIVGPLE